MNQKIISLIVVLTLVGTSFGVLYSADSSNADNSINIDLNVGQTYSNHHTILDSSDKLRSFSCNPTTWNGLTFSGYDDEYHMVSGLIINGTPTVTGKERIDVTLNGTLYNVIVHAWANDTIILTQGVSYNESKDYTLPTGADTTQTDSITPSSWNSLTFSAQTIEGDEGDVFGQFYYQGTPLSTGTTTVSVQFDGEYPYHITVTVVAPTYTVTINTNDNSYGTVSTSTITGVESGTGITVNGNQLTIGSTTVTATPSATTSQYYYTFIGWTNTDGTITADRTITANFTQTSVGPALPESYSVRLSVGQTWSYTPTATPPSATVSISGDATSWISLSNGTISGTAPNVDVLTTYQLVITATTTNPTQTATQTITFTVVPGFEGSASPNTLYLYSGGPIPNTASETISLTHTEFGTGTYTWSMVNDGGIGITVSANGELGGTCVVAPTSSPITVTVRITGTVDGYTQTDDVTFNVVVVAKLVFTSNPLTDAVIS